MGGFEMFLVFEKQNRKQDGPIHDRHSYVSIKIN